MKTPAWQRKEGQSKTGGLNAKGRASYNASTGGDLKAPVKSGDNPRRASFSAHGQYAWARDERWQAHPAALVFEGLGRIV
jgi:hypothetical protein